MECKYSGKLGLKIVDLYRHLLGSGGSFCVLLEGRMNKEVEQYLLSLFCRSREGFLSRPSRSHYAFLLILKDFQSVKQTKINE